ncbi:hypothetical protein EBT16_10135 [bacterium]|nr:hypothetical protein [bacterium]
MICWISSSGFWQLGCNHGRLRRESKKEKELFMLPRLVLIFVFFVLIVLAVKKGLAPKEEVIQRVPGYPAPVALKKFVPLSNEEFLKNLPSAADYALSMSASPEVRSEKKPAKRTVAMKLKMKIKTKMRKHR